ncbi:MAG: sigma-54-dependent Fis family transcriptional regulator [Candidatus Omnitrophica bacterium]|nr:Anaerobic nitric oxide reductase transcription regulator NorR [bacterium]MCC6733236.1 sigma-54-dependent Fis family transcriptional regulator [Candidatus Omnitrophota bacterium]
MSTKKSITSLTGSNGERIVEDLLPFSVQDFALSALDALPFGINIVNRDMRIIYVNQHQQSFFPDRQLGRRICFQAYMNDDQREEVCPWCASKIAFQTGKLVRRVAPSRNQEGIVFKHFEVVAIPLRDKSGEIFAVMELVEDIAGRTFNVPLALEPGKTRNLSQMFAFDRLICASKAMKDLRRRLELFSDNDAPVLIQGETGTGKNLIAEILHENSSRKSKPFIDLNCANMTETLMESELFGHEKGAFTGANSIKKGMVEMAEGGTLLLDEIGDAPMNIQAKLLRFLESGRFERVGGTRTIQVDARIIAATNQDLERRITEGKFREDLFYRLSVLTITVPSLQERPEEIPILVEYFLDQAVKEAGLEPKKIHPRVMRMFLDYSWPGNCRQLKHEIEQMVILGKYDSILTEELVSRKILLSLGKAPYIPDLEADSSSLREVTNLLEKRLIRKALQETNGNKTHAAEMLGLTRRGLLKKIQRLGLG